MNRRSFLLTLSSLGISSSLFGCQNNNQSTLTLKVLKGSLPPQLVGEFKKFYSIA
jgi:putative spermidine/putrescine transport system substrate-binding protein